MLHLGWVYCTQSMEFAISSGRNRKGYLRTPTVYLQQHEYGRGPELHYDNKLARLCFTTLK